MDELRYRYAFADTLKDVCGLKYELGFLTLLDILQDNLSMIELAQVANSFYNQMLKYTEGAEQ